MFYVQSIAKGHIRAKQNAWLPQVYDTEGQTLVLHRVFMQSFPDPWFDPSDAYDTFQFNVYDGEGGQRRRPTFLLVFPSPASVVYDTCQCLWWGRGTEETTSFGAGLSEPRTGVDDTCQCLRWGRGTEGKAHLVACLSTSR